jgi:hypothetical protein
MTMTHRRARWTLGAVAVLIATALLSSAAPASSRGAPRSSAAALDAAVTVFDLNGTYTDGGSARPRITDVNDVLTIDMSSQHRPTATGVVINSDTIIVTFPDDRAYRAKLVAPGTIRWSNGAEWRKLVLVAVPAVIGLTSTTHARPCNPPASSSPSAMCRTARGEMS